MWWVVRHLDGAASEKSELNVRNNNPTGVCEMPWVGKRLLRGQ